jgi:hypothetical protein
MPDASQKLIYSSEKAHIITAAQTRIEKPGKLDVAPHSVHTSQLPPARRLLAAVADYPLFLLLAVLMLYGTAFP